MELLQPRTALLPAAGDVSVDVLEDLQHMNKKICYNLFAVLLHLRNMFATWSPARSPASPAFLFFFSERTVFCFSHLLPGVIFCCRRCFFATCKSNR
jgi:hypothetical protein